MTGSATTCLSRWLRGRLGGSGWAPPRPQVKRGRRGRRRGRRSSRSPLRRQGWRRPCALQRQVPAVQDVRVESASYSVHRRLLDIQNCGSPAVVHRLPSTFFFPLQRLIPTVQTVQQIIETPQLQFVFWWSIRVVRVVQILRCRRGDDARAPTIAVQPQVLCGSDCRKLRKIRSWIIPLVLSTMLIPQLQFLDKVIDVPVVRVVQVLRSRSHARCVQRQVPWLRSAVAAQQQGRLHPCGGAEFDPHGFSVQQTIETPLLPYTWWSMSLLRWSYEFHSCRW